MDVGRIASALVVFMLGLVEVLLGFRFVFKLLAANSTAQFSSWVYASSEPLVAPFQGVFPSFEVAQFSLELPGILAMIVYGVFGIILLQFLRYFEGMKVKTQVNPTPHSTPPSQPQFAQTPPQAPPPQVSQPMPMTPPPPPVQPTPPQENSMYSSQPSAYSPPPEANQPSQEQSNLPPTQQN